MTVNRDDNPDFTPVSPSEDIGRIGATLVSLERWARQRGYTEIADKVGEAADLVDDMLAERDKG